jgi:hypothetical protein
MNPTLCDLVGGIQTVTLSDEEARRRGTQKSVLERKAPPTFEVIAEIQGWDRLAVRHEVADAVDAILRGRTSLPEIRFRDDGGEIHKEEAPQRAAVSYRAGQPDVGVEVQTWPTGTRSVEGGPDKQLRTLRVFPYGISQNRLGQAARSLSVPVIVVSQLGEADVLMTSKSYYRRRPQAIADAERSGMAVYVLRSNTVTQMEHCLADIYGLEPAASDPLSMAIHETQEAIDRIVGGERATVDLLPQDAFVRRKQHEMARAADLASYSKGKEPHRRVRIHQNQ